MARRTSPAQDAPQTLEAAIVELETYAVAAAQISELDAIQEEAIARIRAEHDKAAAPLEAKMQEIFKRLKPWWAVAREALTGGKRKSIELGGCVIGHRTSTPSLKAPSPVGAAIAMLLDREWNGLIRDNPELDKPAIMRALADDESPIREELAQLGFKIQQPEKFFIDRLPPKPADVVVEQQEAA